MARKPMREITFCSVNPASPSRRRRSENVSGAAVRSGFTIHLSFQRGTAIASVGVEKSNGDATHKPAGVGSERRTPLRQGRGTVHSAAPLREVLCVLRWPWTPHWRRADAGAYSLAGDSAGLGKCVDLSQSAWPYTSGWM